jgi:hypothetical protein
MKRIPPALPKSKSLRAHADSITRRAARGDVKALKRLLKIAEDVDGVAAEMHATVPHRGLSHFGRREVREVPWRAAVYVSCDGEELDLERRPRLSRNCISAAPFSGENQALFAAR